MRPTASRAALMRSCQWWMRGDVRPDPRTSSPAAERGTAIHAAIEARLRGGAGSLGEPRQVASALAILDPSLGTIDAEVAYWRTADGRFGSARLDAAREYPPDAVIAGTADVVQRVGGCLIIYDWKTGERDEAKAARYAAQMRAIAWLAASVRGVRYVQTFVVWLDEPGATMDFQTLDALDLDAEGEELLGLLALAPHTTPAPGDHCVYCPAKGTCPGLREALEALDARGQSPREIGSPEQASALLALLARTRDAADGLEAQLRAWADQHGGIVQGDRTWCRRDQRRASIAIDGPSGAEALAILDRHGVGGAIDRTPTVSQASITEALGGGKGTAARVAAIMADLRAAGAVREKIVSVYGLGRGRKE